MQESNDPIPGGKNVLVELENTPEAITGLTAGEQHHEGDGVAFFYERVAVPINGDERFPVEGGLNRHIEVPFRVIESVPDFLAIPPDQFIKNFFHGAARDLHFQFLLSQDIGNHRKA